MLPIEPITDESLPDFCQFLHENMEESRSREDWIAAFRVPWECRRPNYGFMMRDIDGKVVGGLGAIYSRQVVRGQPHNFCNLTSWCVKDAYRPQSMRLALAIIEQQGYEITNFSPTKVVAEALRFLKFQEIDDRISFVMNVPWILGRVTVCHDLERERQDMAGNLKEIYRDHATYPWLRFLLLIDGTRQCLLIIKETSRKGLKGVKILYVSDLSLYAQHLRAVSSRLLFRFGALFTQIETRLLTRRVRLSMESSGYTRKLYLSRGLSANDIQYVYSESMCLDL